MNDNPGLIYKIEDAAVWRVAAATGCYVGSADDLRDGFIHFSTAATAAGTAARHFTGRHDLVLVAIRASDLGPALKWEASRGGLLFPHLYGALDMTHVAWMLPLPLGADGRHAFPEEMV